MRTYDVAIIGLGAMGSAAAYHLARRGSRVIGLEQFTPAHDRGSSHGKSRIIREAYFEDPAYVPLVQRAHALWTALEHDVGVPLLVITRGLMIGPPEGELIRGALASATTHKLSYEVLSPSEIRARFPVFRPDESMTGVLEPRAGILFPEASVQAHVAAATRAGADLRFEEPVQQWRAMTDHVEVMSSRTTYMADHLVITAGPWAADVIYDLSLPLRVERNVQFWFRPLADVDFSPERVPIYLWEHQLGAFFYGFPALSSAGVKVARHHSGVFCTPETFRREVSDAEIAAMRDLLRRYLPGAAGQALETAACMYTNTPDGHFVIDHHPASSRVTIACGFSGHGFKFASVVGEILADLARDHRTPHPIDLFRLVRFQEPRAVRQI